MRKVVIIGGGLAGSEAAWQIAKRNINVINNKIADCLRLLRLSPNTRRDYTDQILFELKIIE